MAEELSNFLTVSWVKYHGGLQLFFTHAVWKTKTYTLI